MPADVQTLAAARDSVRQARYALHALAQARRALLLRNKATGNYQTPIKEARDTLRNTRAMLAAIRKS